MQGHSGAVSLHDLKNKRQVEDFLHLSFSIYKDIPQWVPPLQMDERLKLNRQRFPFYKHSHAAFFIAYDVVDQYKGWVSVVATSGRTYAAKRRLKSLLHNISSAIQYHYPLRKDSHKVQIPKRRKYIMKAQQAQGQK